MFNSLNRKDRKVVQEVSIAYLVDATPEGHRIRTLVSLMAKMQSEVDRQRELLDAQAESLVELRLLANAPKEVEDEDSLDRLEKRVKRGGAGG